MPRVRYNWRQNLSAPRATVVDQTKDNLANARMAQFPLQNEAREAQVARAQASEAKARYQMGREIETDRQRTAFYNGLQELESSLNGQGHTVGTREHAEAFAAYAHEFPLARSSADVNNYLKLHATIADDQAALKQRIRDLSPPPEKIAARYAKVQADIQQFNDLSSQEETANIAAGKANVPFTKAPSLHASTREAALLEQQYPTLAQSTPEPTNAPVVPTMPAQVVTPDSIPSTSEAVPSVTPVDPRMDLARRALVDPNATDAHRARARQILGVTEDAE